uniref:Uncharacterized protein n=2 Tax=Anopheles merus TaxID=30066 RepID=A0A182UTJ0_ANOME
MVHNTYLTDSYLAVLAFSRRESVHLLTSEKMSDDDTPRTAVSPPLNCAKPEAAPSSPVEPEQREQRQLAEKGQPVVDDVKVKRETERETEPHGASSRVLPPLNRPDDHEAITNRRRKCVQFTTPAAAGSATADDTLLKFIEGEEILDKENPFKTDELASVLEKQYGTVHRQTDSVRDKTFPGNAASIDDDDDDGEDDGGDNTDTDLDSDNVFITKEEVLRQSKYVKTYIKNPDKQLNYDKSVIQKLNALKAKGRQVRDVVVMEGTTPSPPGVRPPIPAPRTVHQRQQQSDRNNNSRRQQRSPQTVSLRGGNPKPVPRARRYDYAEVKVRIGSAETEESLYDSNEVVQNALKFDSRFRKVEFGSQDDIDTIAERTEDGSDQTVGQTTVQSRRTRYTPETTVQSRESPSKSVSAGKGSVNGSPAKKDQPDGRKSTFAEDVKKSFSNTVKSADFRKYLQSKGLSLVPAKPKAIEGSPRVSGQVDSAESVGKSLRLSAISTSSTPTRLQQAKPSVLARLFQNNGLFTPKTPNEPAYSAVFARSSTPVLLGSQQGRLTPRSQLPIRFGSFNGSLNRRSAATADVKPKVNFKQLVDGQGETVAAPVRRPASVNEFERPKLRTHFANRSVSSVDSLKRPMRNAGVQVNLAANGGSNNSQIIPTNHQIVPASQQRPGSWQGAVPVPHSGHPPVGMVQSPPQPPPAAAYQSIRQRPDAARFYGGGSTHTVAPLYSEPLRELPMMVQDEVDSGFRSAVDNGYHIYEQTPDNLRRSELVYGKIGYLSNTQLNRWHPQDRRSYSSMQEGVAGTGSNGGTYGRLRPVYVSSPLSTQSTPVRRASDVLDREQILHRIYDFCRRSIRNSSKTSVNSNHTEPTYQSSNGTPGTTKLVPSGTFPIERQRVQRVQSLNTPRPLAPTNQYGTGRYTRAVTAVPTVPMHYHPSNSQPIVTGRQNQHERNIENIYAFVNKKMVQMNVAGGDDRSVRSVQTSAPSTLRRVTFSSTDRPPGVVMTDGLDEADYVNIRGAPDGIQYRTT